MGREDMASSELLFGGGMFGVWVVWFGNNISSILGDDTYFCFWKEKWIGTVLLRESFSDLFDKSLQQECNISAMCVWESNEWRWKFVWKIVLSDTEKASAHDLLLLLEHFRPRRDLSDRQKWIPHASGMFSVNFAYVSLLNRLVMEAIESNTMLALKKLWKTNIPS
jgi:hypothetical protein